MCPIADADEPTGQTPEPSSSVGLEQAGDSEESLLAGTPEDSKIEEAAEIVEQSAYSELAEGLVPGVDYVEGEAISWLEPSEMKDGKTINVKTGKDRVFQEVAKKALASGLVRAVEPNMILASASQGMPKIVSDFDISIRSLENQFDPSSEKSPFWNLNSINAISGWDFSRCCGKVSVAVLDSGIDFDHPDLKTNIDREHAWDVVDDRPLTKDLMGHGTSVASVISARNYNLRGIDGVSYNAKIVPVNIGRWVLVDPEKDARKVQSDSAAMAKGINRVVGDSGIDNLKVINISFTGFRAPPDGALQDAIDNAYIHGVHVVCAAGNSGREQRSYPSDLDHVISVSGVGRSNDGARWSGSTYGSGKDIAAPAEDILVALPNATYGQLNGTSFATPMVSGSLALMYAANPNLTAADAEHALFSSATDIGAQGFDKEFGWGSRKKYGDSSNA